MHPGARSKQPGLLSETEYTAGIAPLDDPAVVDVPFANVAAWGRRSPK